MSALGLCWGPMHPGVPARAVWVVDTHGQVLSLCDRCGVQLVGQLQAAHVPFLVKPARRD